MFIDSSFHIATHFCLERIVFFPYGLSFSSFLSPSFSLRSVYLFRTSFSGGHILCFPFFVFLLFGNLPFEDICYLFPANIAECLHLFPYSCSFFLSFFLSFSFVLVIFFLSSYSPCFFLVFFHPVDPLAVFLSFGFSFLG